MDGQRIGSAKKNMPYNNILILHKSEKQTVKDQYGKRVVLKMMKLAAYLV